MTAAVLLLLAAASPQFEAVSRRASQAREANQHVEALRLYRRAVQIRPNWAEGWWYIGSLHYEQAQYTQSKSALARYLELDSKAAPGWALLGLSEYELKNYHAALEKLSIAKSRGLPDGSELANAARYHRAVLNTHFGEYEAAFDELKRFPFLSVETPAVLEAIGVAGLRMPLLPGELAADQRDLVMKTGRAVYDCWAVRIADAEGEFRELILTFPDNPHLHYLYGAFLLASHPEDGLRELRKCLQLDPQYVPAMLQAAFAYLKLGQAAQGLGFAERAAGLQPGSFLAHLAFGRVLIETAAVERGTRELETAVRLAPEQAECRFALASAYTKAGREQDAARERAEFMRLDALRRQAEEK